MEVVTKILGFGFAPQYRKIGNQVFLRGTSQISEGNLPTSGSISPFGSLPEGYRPQQVVYFVGKADGPYYVTGQVNPGGTISVNPRKCWNKSMG